MKERYELVGGPLDGGIIEIDAVSDARTVVLEPPHARIRVFYTTDPENNHKFLYIGSRPVTDTGIKTDATN